MAEEAARVVAVPHGVVLADRDAARPRVLGPAAGTRVMTSVFGSALAILFELNSSKNGTPFESRRTPYGREFTVGDSTSLMLPSGAFGSSVPMKLPACTVKNSRPSAQERDRVRIAAPSGSASCTR